MNQNDNIVDTLSNQLSFFGKLTAEQMAALIDFSLKAKELTQDNLSLCRGIPTVFNLFQTHHYTIFLYRLARLIYENGGQPDLCERLYLLNKMVNGVDLYYKINMPQYFLVGHGLGTVFSRAQYGNYLVIFQNVTIGTQDGIYPTIGEKVVIYPNSVVIGNSVIGENSVIGAGTILINKSISENSVVFQQNGVLTIKKNNRNEIQKYFNVSSI